MEINELSELARRERVGKDAETRITKARIKIALSKDPQIAFHSPLVFRLRPQPNWDIETAATNGRELFYNPDFVAGLKPEELQGVIIHEVWHCAQAHFARQGARDLPTWNLACDMSINPQLIDCGFSLPDGAVMPEQIGMQRGLAAETYYAALLQQQGQQQGQGNDPGRCGGVIADSGTSQAQQAALAASWKAATEAARITHRGTLPAGLGSLIDAAAESRVDWREALRRFVSKRARNDYEWARPNRRFVHQGIYLPSLGGLSVGRIAIHIDTSGSTRCILPQFAAEIEAIGEEYPDFEAVIIHCDCAIALEEWRPSDGPFRLTAHGGGGTSHVPVFEWLAENEPDAAALISLTDLYSDFPADPPVMPVLWVAPDGSGQPPEWGELIRITD